MMLKYANPIHDAFVTAPQCSCTAPGKTNGTHTAAPVRNVQHCTFRLPYRRVSGLLPTR